MHGNNFIIIYYQNVEIFIYIHSKELSCMHVHLSIFLYIHIHIQKFNMQIYFPDSFNSLLTNCLLSNTPNTRVYIKETYLVAVKCIF